MAGLQVGNDVVFRPSAQSKTRIVCDVGSRPALEIGSLQILIALVAAEKSFWRMTGAAMRRAIDQECAAIPFSRLVGIRSIIAFAEIEGVPDPHGGANVEREWQRIGDKGIKDRRYRIQIGADRKDIVAGHLCIGIVWHRRVEARAIASYAVPDRRIERFVAPTADPG